MAPHLGPSGGRCWWWGQRLGTSSTASAIVCPVPSCFWGQHSLIQRILVPLPWPLRSCLSSCCKKCLGVKGGFRGRSPDLICYCSTCAVLCRWHPPLPSSLLQSFSSPLIHTFQYLWDDPKMLPGEQCWRDHNVLGSPSSATSLQVCHRAPGWPELAAALGSFQRRRQESQVSLCSEP